MTEMKRGAGYGARSHNNRMRAGRERLTKLEKSGNGPATGQTAARRRLEEEKRRLRNSLGITLQDKEKPIKKDGEKIGTEITRPNDEQISAAKNSQFRTQHDPAAYIKPGDRTGAPNMPIAGDDEEARRRSRAKRRGGRSGSMLTRRDTLG
jgi:hypothetical protein